MSVVMEEKTSDPMENLKKKPVKSILKSSSFEVPDGPSGSNRRASKSKEPKGTKWDEMNILETLHPADKDYGFMKIEEPKTPYERTFSEDTLDNLDPNVLAEKIVEICNKSPKNVSRTTSVSTSDSDEELTPEEKEKKKKFEKRRKAHYNEFLMAKKAMKELQDEDEDEEE